MKRAIKKNAGVFTAIIFLLILAFGIASYILSHQRFYLPAWVPLIGTDFYEVKADLPTAQAVVPGQGQTVNIAGVKVGEVGAVNLVDGHAVVDMQIQEKYAPIYRNSTILLRPKTGLKDMYLALDPGTPDSGELPEGGHVRLANTLQDVNADEVLAQLDTDTRTYLRVLINSGGEAFDDSGRPPGEQSAAADLRETLKRFEPLSRNGRKITRLLVKRRQNIKRVIHNFQLLSTELGTKDKQLAALVDSANANFSALADEQASIREALVLFPPTLSQTQTTLTKVSGLAAQLGPALQRLRPFARDLAPALRATQPFLRETTPIIRDQVRPFARDVQPTVRDLQSATKDLAVVTPKLTSTFKVLNALFNTLAYDPPGRANSFLYWSGWGAHAGVTLWDTQDAHGPIRRGAVLVSCPSYDTLEAVAAGNPQLGMVIHLLNLPPEQEACPNNLPDNQFP